MSERDTLKKVKDKQSLFDIVQNFFTFGYGTKEDLREVDKKLRDFYYSDFKAIRRLWEEIYLAALEADQNQAGSKLKAVIQIIDRISEKVHHADYGYAGLFDRKGSIRENELARVFDHDKDLEKHLVNITETINKLHKDTENENWENIQAKVRNVKSLIQDFENKWDEREKQFRPLEI